MRFVSRLIAVMSITLVAASGSALADGFTFKVDPVFSSVTFKVKHRDLSFVLGRFNKLSGRIVSDSPTKPNTLDVKVDVTVKSLDTNHKKRDSHLKGKDFFNARKNREIGFESTSGKKIDKETFEVTGKLTLNGVTKTVTMTMHLVGMKQIAPLIYRIGVETTFTVLRSEFGLDQMLDEIADEVTVIVNLQAEYERPPIG